MSVTARGALPIQLQTIDDKEKKRMPSTSKAQQAVMAIAANSPEKLYKRNRSVLGMSKGQLTDFASTKTKDLPEHAPKKKERAGKRMFRKG